MGIAEASGFPVDRSDPPWSKAHPGIVQDEDGQEAARSAYGDWKERLRTVASGSDRASDALEPGGTWNAYVRAITGFMSGVGPEQISATDYLAYDDASTGKNWNLPLSYGLGRYLRGGDDPTALGQRPERGAAAPELVVVVGRPDLLFDRRRRLGRCDGGQRWRLAEVLRIHHPLLILTDAKRRLRMCFSLLSQH